MTITKSLLVSLPLPRTSPHRITSSFGATKVRLYGRKSNVMGGVECSTPLRMSVRNAFLASESPISLSDSWNYDDDDQDFVDRLSSWNCIGSSHGWLGYINPHDLSFYLFKPSLINNPSYLPYISLPPIQFLSDDPNVISKMVFSSSPSPIPRRTLDKDNNSSILVVITLDRVDPHGPAAAICRVGDPNWTTLATNFPKESCSNNFQDITYYSKHNLFYVVTDSWEIYSWDLSNYHYCQMKQHQMWSNFRYLTKLPPRREFPIPTSGEYPESKCYLVTDESSGSLMVICLQIGLCKTRKEKMYKHQVDRLDVDKLEWFPVNALVDTALLIGRNNGIVVDVRLVPGLLMPGHIYLACNACNFFQLTALKVQHGFPYNRELLRAQMTMEDDIMTSFPVWNFE